jgi:uncharacterized membrane protein
MKEFIINMKKRIAHTANCMNTGTQSLPTKLQIFKMRSRAVLVSNRAEGYIDTAVKILIAVVLGALLLAGLYALLEGTVLPTLVQRIKEMFNYAG